VAGAANELNQINQFLPAYATVDWSPRGELASVTAEGVVHDWSWDALGRGRICTISGNGLQPSDVYYQYDGLSRLVLRDDGVGGAVEFTHHNDTLVGIRASTGAVIYVEGGLEGKPVARVSTTGTVEPVWTDAFGNIVVQKGSAYKFDPYGVRWNAAGQRANPDLDELGFVGAWRDPLTHVYALGPRFYNETWGSFISRDPLGESVSLNLYQYANRNPLKWGDPSGLAPVEHDGPEGQGRVAFDSRYWDIGAETFSSLLNEWLDDGGGREAVAERFGHLISDEKYLETLSPAELAMAAATFLDLPDGAMTTEQEGNFKRDLERYYAVAKAAERTQQAIAYTISGFADPTGALIESAAESIGVSPELLDRIRSVKDASALLRGNVIGVLKNGMRGAHSQVLSVAGEGAEQYKRITNSEIKRWQKKFGFDAHDLKPDSKYDLFKDKHGRIIVKPRDGRGPGEWTGYNIDEFR
jgi:RHS repeat-associated protein